jgi:hypothetical protein
VVGDRYDVLGDLGDEVDGVGLGRCRLQKDQRSKPLTAISRLSHTKARISQDVRAFFCAPEPRWQKNSLAFIESFENDTDTVTGSCERSTTEHQARETVAFFGSAT